MIRFPLSMAMLALCFVAWQCTANEPDVGKDDHTRSGGGGDPGPEGNEAGSARTDGADAEKQKEDQAASLTVTTTTAENKPLGHTGGIDADNPSGISSPDVSTDKSGPADSSTFHSSSSSSSVANKGSNGAGLDLGATTGPAGPAGPEADVNGGHKDRAGAGGTATGGVVGGVGPAGQGNTSNSGTGGAGTGLRLSTGEPGSFDNSGSEKRSSVGGHSTVLLPGSGGERPRPGDIVTDSGSTGTVRSPGHSVEGSSVSPGSKKPSHPKAPVGEEVTPIQDAHGGPNGNKALSPAPQKPSTPTKPAARDTSTQTTEQATSRGGQPALKVPTATPSTSSVAQPGQKPAAANPREKDMTLLQTLKSTTSTSAPKDSTQASVTSTTKSAKGESTAPETSLPKLSPTLQSVDKNDGSNKSASLVAFTALITLVVMAVAPAF